MCRAVYWRPCCFVPAARVHINKTDLTGWGKEGIYTYNKKEIYRVKKGENIE